ncbi:MAG: prepilin-type N-terminal cleavage/methylation domain-containing protein, partial [Phycisphaerae bacterium]|nr:prepilin-type N-terminal cleavage/methylation domain-containing protein [Phycisphaerae bacterium]
MTSVCPIPPRAGHPGRDRSGFSMVELMTALVVMTILLGAITSILLLASRAAGQVDAPTARATKAAEAIGALSADLNLALVFVYTGTQAVEFTVPDRDGDGEAELIRYEWSDAGGNLGIAGAPLKRQINGGAWAVVAEDVHQLNLSYLLKTWGPPPPPPEVESGEIILAEHDDDPGGASVRARDADRISLIQSWAYDVTSIDSGTSQAALDTAVAAHDVAYLPAGLSDQALGTKLRQADIGVVSESGPLADEMGLTDLPVLPVTKEKVRIHRD